MQLEENTHKKSIISFDSDKRSSKENQLKNVQKHSLRYKKHQYYKTISKTELG